MQKIWPISPSLPEVRAAHVQGGFTLIEVMVAIAIIAILAAMAAPSFQRQIERYQVRVVSEDLRASVGLARSEALRRGGGVALRACDADEGCTWKIVAGTDSIQQSAASPAVKVDLPDDGVQFDGWGLAGGCVDFTATSVRNSAATRTFHLQPAGAIGEAACS